MKPEDALLIEKFLDGSISENDAQALLQKVENKQISFEEIDLASQIHGHLFAKFHSDKNNSILHNKIRNKLSEKDKKLSERIIKKIKTKKQSKTIWVLAASLFLSCLAGVIFYTQMKSKVEINIINTPPLKQIALNSTIKNETAFIQYYGLADGSQIDLFPNSILTRTKDNVFLEKGKLSASINKQSSPLFFNTKEANCQIIGTKFILQSFTQQNKPATELIVTEGLVEMQAFSNKEKVSNQKCLSTSYNQKLVLSSLPSLETMNDIFNPNIIYASHFESKVMDSFWQNWNKNDRLLSNPNTLNLFVDKNTKETFIQSQIFKTYLQSTNYHFEIQPEIISGSMEVIVIFSRKSATYHQIGYVITKEVDAFSVQNYEFNDGVHLNMEKLIYKDSIPKIIIDGPIANRTIPLDAKDKSKFRICKCALEDISIKILIKNLKDGEGHIDIIKGKIERTPAKSDTK